jgi:hypothetical protein
MMIANENKSLISHIKVKPLEFTQVACAFFSRLTNVEPLVSSVYYKCPVSKSIQHVLHRIDPPERRVVVQS